MSISNNLGISNNLFTSGNNVNNKLGLLSDNSIQRENHIQINDEGDEKEVSENLERENDYIDSSNNSISINSINISQGL